jgi:hypothetical protein
VSRALQLAAHEGLPTVLVGQPLFLGEIAARYGRAGHPWPPALVILSGGYPMPRSLETFVRRRCASVSHVAILHLYGTAEVDAACLMAMERDDDGQLLYHPRGDEIGMEVIDGELCLSLRDAEGRTLVDRYRTGDACEKRGDAVVLSNALRFAPATLSALERWSSTEWERRTGYLGRGAEGQLLAQLRVDEAPTSAGELDFFDFARTFRSSWLGKPCWE